MPSKRLKHSWRLMYQVTSKITIHFYFSTWSFWTTILVPDIFLNKQQNNIPAAINEKVFFQTNIISIVMLFLTFSRVDFSLECLPFFKTSPLSSAQLLSLQYKYIASDLKHIRRAFNKFPDFFCSGIKIVVDPWKFCIILIYVLWDDWPMFRISHSKEQLHLTKAWLSQLVNFKNAIWHFIRTICNKLLL